MSSKSEIKIITSKLFQKFPEIIFGFSTKIGLDRKPPYNFNLSLTVGDKRSIVIENRNEFIKSIGLKSDQVIFQKQIHSDIINIVEKLSRKVSGSQYLQLTAFLFLYTIK